MLPGETAWKNGYQVALFPMDYINMSQAYGPGTYSHCCNMATDWAAPGNISGYAYYAPCDCYQLGISGSDNIARYRSAHEVYTPSGIKYITWCFMHDNDPPVYAPDYLIRQGDRIGATGTAGLGTGPHLHLDQASGSNFTLYNSGQSCTIGVDCYKPYDELAPTNVWYLTGNELFVQTGSLQFQTISGSTPGGGFKWWFSEPQLRRRKNV